MKTMILLFCLLGSTQSLPQHNPASGLPPTKLAPDQAILLNQQQPKQVFPSLHLIPLTQLLTLGSDLQLLNPVAGMTPGAQTLPLALGRLNVQHQLQPQMLPIIVAQLGAQGTVLSSEELPVAPQIFTGLIIHPLFPGGILSTSQTGANPEVHNGILPAGQAGVNPAIQGTPGGHLPTPSDTDDELDVATPAGILRGMHTTEETTTESPNVTMICKTSDSEGVATYSQGLLVRHIADYPSIQDFLIFSHDSIEVTDFKEDTTEVTCPSQCFIQEVNGRHSGEGTHLGDILTSFMDLFDCQVIRGAIDANWASSVKVL
ncbi:amelotin [Tupaia chinensis]|uniref:amelotin n=1 Tax=Tupaia chinensis TaxID=246437 RepID=UPI0003C8CC28|nr:amelotin [Tupaia chinensis]